MFYNYLIQSILTDKKHLKQYRAFHISTKEEVVITLFAVTEEFDQKVLLEDPEFGECFAYQEWRTLRTWPVYDKVKQKLRITANAGKKNRNIVVLLEQCVKTLGDMLVSGAMVRFTLVRRWLKRLLQILNWIHENGMQYKHLNPYQMIVDDHDQLLLRFPTWFFNSKLAPDTQPYRPMESFFSLDLSFPIHHWDVWALGCTLMEIYYSTPYPFFNEKDFSWQCMQIFQLLGHPTSQDLYYLGKEYYELDLPVQRETRISQLLEGLSPELTDFVELCLCYSPRIRPRVSTLLQHDLICARLDREPDLRVLTFPVVPHQHYVSVAPKGESRWWDDSDDCVEVKPAPSVKPEQKRDRSPTKSIISSVMPVFQEPDLYESILSDSDCESDFEEVTPNRALTRSRSSSPLKRKPLTKSPILSRAQDKENICLENRLTLNNISHNHTNIIPKRKPELKRPRVISNASTILPKRRPQTKASSKCNMKKKSKKKQTKKLKATKAMSHSIYNESLKRPERLLNTCNSESIDISPKMSDIRKHTGRRKSFPISPKNFTRTSTKKRSIDPSHDLKSDASIPFRNNFDVMSAGDPTPQKYHFHPESPNYDTPKTYHSQPTPVRSRELFSLETSPPQSCHVWPERSKKKSSDPEEFSKPTKKSSDFVFETDVSSVPDHDSNAFHELTFSSESINQSYKQATPDTSLVIINKPHHEILLQFRFENFTRPSEPLSKCQCGYFEFDIGGTNYRTPVLVLDMTTKIDCSSVSSLVAITKKEMAKLLELSKLEIFFFGSQDVSRPDTYRPVGVCYLDVSILRHFHVIDGYYNFYDVGEQNPIIAIGQIKISVKPKTV